MSDLLSLGLERYVWSLRLEKRFGRCMLAFHMGGRGRSERRGCWPELTQDSSMECDQVRAQAGGQLSCISSQGGTCPLHSSSLSTFSPTLFMSPPPPTAPQQSWDDEPQAVEEGAGQERGGA